MTSIEYLADAPLEDPDADRFGRSAFANRVADTLAERREGATLVVGLYAPWGAGKTTVLNFIKARLDKHEDVVRATFNPWLFSSTAQLLQEFFSLVGDTLEKRLTKRREDLGRLLSRAGAVASGVSLAASGGFVDPGQAMKGVAQLLSSVDVEEMRSRVSQALHEENKRVVILIDDIDRLDVEETLMLFRLIKLVADFENTSYILAFDQKVVASALSRRYPERAEMGTSFIDKIVQVPLSLPPARPDLLLAIVFEGIDKLLLLEEISLTDEDVYRFRSNFDRAIGPLVSTPRIATRYLNALQFAIPTLKSEVNIVDLLLIEAIRVTMPPLYEWLPGNEPLLIVPQLALGGPAVSAEVIETLDGAFSFLPTARVEGAKALVRSLFPRTEGIWGNTTWGSDWEETWAQQKRATSESYFDRFFLYSVPPDDVADSAVDRLLEGVEGGEADLDLQLHDLLESDRARPLVTKLRLRAANLSDEGARRLVVALAAVAGSLPHDEVGVFSRSVGEDAALLIVDLLESIEDQEERSELAVAIAQTANPLTFAALVVRWILVPRSGRGQELPLLPQPAADRVRENLAARALKAEQASSLLLDVDWAGQLYGLIAESSRAAELRAILAERTTDLASAASLVRAYMSRTQDLSTGRKGRSPLDGNDLEALKTVVDTRGLYTTFAAQVGREEGETGEVRGDDDDSIARNFVRLLNRLEVQGSGSIEPSEAVPRDGTTGDTSE